MFEPGLQDEIELIGIAGGRLVRRHLQHQRKIAFTYPEIALARSEFRAQRQFAAQTLERGLHELPHVWQRTRLGARARQPRQHADDAEQLDLLAAHREGVHGAVGIDPRDAGKLRRVRQSVCNRILHEFAVVDVIPFLRGPDQIGEPVVHDYGAQARHEHPQQTAVGFE